MLDGFNSVFIVGIKGVGMAGIAVILKKMGKNVTGSDIDEEFITDDELKKNNIQWTVGFDSSNLPDHTEAVIYSAAHGGDDNPQVVEARKRGIKIMHQAEFLGELLKNFKKTIAVCGTHGKTSTASLLAYSLIKLGAKPSYLVGSSSFNEYSGGDYLGDEYFVLEADEYGVNPPKDKTPKLKFIHPDIILYTNIDFDHPDVYKDINDVRKAFNDFFLHAKKVISCPENEDSTLDKHESNRLGVEQALIELGFEIDAIQKAMQGFTGAKRRFEQIAHENDIYLLDDYAHHPREIEATIKKAREKFPDRRILILFQSHTYSRTKALLNEFSAALKMADTALVGPIFPSARENPAEFGDVKIPEHKNFDSFKGLIAELPHIIKKGDVIFTMGAGDIYKFARDIIQIIKKV